MSDYTDINLHIENAYEELKKAEELFQTIDKPEYHPNTIIIAGMIREDFDEIKRKLNKIWERVDEVSDDFEEQMKK